MTTNAPPSRISTGGNRLNSCGSSTECAHILWLESASELSRVIAEYTTCSHAFCPAVKSCASVSSKRGGYPCQGCAWEARQWWCPGLFRVRHREWRWRLCTLGWLACRWFIMIRFGALANSTLHLRDIFLTHAALVAVGRPATPVTTGGSWIHTCCSREAEPEGSLTLSRPCGFDTCMAGSLNSPMRCGTTNLDPSPCPSAFASDA